MNRGPDEIAHAVVRRPHGLHFVLSGIHLHMPGGNPPAFHQEPMRPGDGDDVLEAFQFRPRIVKAWTQTHYCDGTILAFSELKPVGDNGNRVSDVLNADLCRTRDWDFVALAPV